MYPETIEWCDKIIQNYPEDQMEALHLTACSYYSMLDIDQCLKHLALIWKKSNNCFEDEYLNDKRFKYMFSGITQLNKNNPL